MSPRFDLSETTFRGYNKIAKFWEKFNIFVAFRAFVAFMGHWGWTLVAFTELVVFRGVGLVVGGV